MNKALAAGAALTLAALLAGPALASGFGGGAPGPASSNTNCNGAVSDPVACAQGGASASVQTQPFVLLQASAGGSPGQDAFATLDYDFVVTGGNDGDAVQIGLTTHMVTSLTGAGTSFAQISYSDADASGDRSVCDSTDPAATACANNHVFDGTLSFAGEVGDVGHIHMFIDADSGFGGSGFASIDPQMFVMFDLNGIHGIELSPGISNALPGAGGAPEPASWALLLGGFGLAGAALRRRRAGTVRA